MLSQELLEIDEGHLDTDKEGMVLFPHQFCHVEKSEDELIDQVFPNLQQYILDEKWLCERTILAPKNKTIAKINKKILGEIARETSVYNSIDTVMSSDDTTSYPVEFLNSLELSGVPSHKLELKVGVPIFFVNTQLGRAKIMLRYSVANHRTRKAYSEAHNLNWRSQGRQCSCTTYPNHTQ
ncbi:ATP-dependent DNA helicase [Trichonephila clavipes]|nr:ATP-dependent DNA helicase [Trichonephila clavipes]